MKRSLIFRKRIVCSTFSARLPIDVSIGTMAAQLTWWSNFNDVDDQTLRNIVKYGKLENIVSKERISTKFGAAVDAVLLKIRSFDTDTRKFSMSSSGLNGIPHNLRLIKRMPKLDDCYLLLNWGNHKESLTQLAAINSSLFRTYGPSYILHPSSASISYIGAVKDLHPNFDGRKVEHFIGLRAAIPLLEKYPDLKLKLVMRGSEMVEPYFQLCHTLRLKDPGDRLDRFQLYPSVEHVKINGDYGQFSDLTLFPNLKKLIVHCTATTTIKVRTVMPYLKSDLRYLEFCFKSWDADNFATLTSIINTRPLTGFKLYVIEEYPERKVLDMILDSPTSQLKELGSTTFWIDGNELKIVGKGWRELFTDKDFVMRLLLKFKHVEYILYFHEVDQLSLDMIKDICNQVEGANHRRSFKFRPLFILTALSYQLLSVEDV